MGIEDRRGTVDAAVFADDSSILVQLRSVVEYEDLRIFYLLSEIPKFSSNQAMTEILAFNTPRELINRINSLNKGKVVTQVRHIGIILTMKNTD